MRLAMAAMMMAMAVATQASAESPSYEVQGFPVTEHQAQLLAPAEMHEQAPVAGATSGGMPASPAQISLLAPRRQIDPTEIAERLAAHGYSEVRVLMPTAYQVSAIRNGVPVVLTVDMRTGDTK